MIKIRQIMTNFLSDLLGYGWAIIVITVALGSLTYFGIFTIDDLKLQNQINNACCYEFCNQFEKECLDYNLDYNNEYDYIICSENISVNNSDNNFYIIEKTEYIIDNISIICKNKTKVIENE